MRGGSGSSDAMMAAFQRFHDKHDLRNRGGEELTYRMSLMAEELGEISSRVTKGKPVEELAEEMAGLLILVVGTGISAQLDLKKAFRSKMEKLMQRDARMVGGRIRVSGFRNVD